MIDIRQLTIGSHVSVDGKRVRVDEISTLRLSGTPMTLIVSHDGLCDGRVSIEDIEPILLDREILSEVEFRKGMSLSIGFDCWYRDSIRIDNNVMQAHPWWFYNQVKLRYLHELESLYYLICKTELIKD